MKNQTMLYRQGDVLFRRIAKLPSGDQKKRENATVAYGEVTGHSHALAVEDRQAAEILEIGDGLFLVVSDKGLRVHQIVDVIDRDGEQWGCYHVEGQTLPAVIRGCVSPTVEGVALVHEEHGPTIFTPGLYQHGPEHGIQREYQPDSIRNVID